MKFETNAHSVYLLQYHLVLVIKYRRRVITPAMDAYLRSIFLTIAPEYHIVLVEWGVEADHVHVLFRARPDSSLSRFIGTYKSASSRIIKQQFPEIRRYLWKEYFWSRSWSFCLLTTGGATVDVIRRYIESQRMPHDRKHKH